MGVVTHIDNAFKKTAVAVMHSHDSIKHAAKVAVQLMKCLSYNMRKELVRIGLNVSCSRFRLRRRWWRNMQVSYMGC